MISIFWLLHFVEVTSMVSTSLIGVLQLETSWGKQETFNNQAEQFEGEELPVQGGTVNGS